MREREKQIMSGFVKIGEVLREMPSASPRLYHLFFFRLSRVAQEAAEHNNEKSGKVLALDYIC